MSAQHEAFSLSENEISHQVREARFVPGLETEDSFKNWKRENLVLIPNREHSNSSCAN